MEQEKLQQPQWLTTATVKDGMLTTTQRLYWEDKLRDEMASFFDQEYGAGNWLIVQTDELPKDFSTDTYTVENGQLVPASAEVLEARRKAENSRKAETIRAERDRRLAATDKYLIPDFPISEKEREQYRAYRQYLRDLPETDGFPDVPIMTFGEFAGTE